MRAFLFSVVTALVLVCIIPQAAQASDDGPTAVHTLYAEALGPAGYYSANYEHRISDFGVRLGFSHFGNSYFNLTAIPIGFNYIGVGGDRAHLEVGGVATVAIIDGQGFLGDAAGVIASGIVGFRYQPPHGGFNFRVGASPMIGAFGAYPWGYVSFGGTFGGSKNRTVTSADGAIASETAPARPTDAKPTEAAGSVSASQPPTGFGGFAFSMTVDEARTVCETSGHAFSESGKLVACDSPARSIGLDGSIQMLKCDDRFCQILFTATPVEERIVAEVVRLKEALEKQYGSPSESLSAVPQECHRHVIECVETQRAYLEYAWHFPDGESIKLRLGKRRTPGATAEVIDPKVHLLYKRKAAAAVAVSPRVAPSGFGGFEFSMTPGQARRACETAGRVWAESDKVGTCDGLAQPTAAAGSVQLLRCGSSFCQVLFTTEPDERELMSTVVDLKAEFERRYGPPDDTNLHIPQECYDTLSDCIRARTAYLEYAWKFSTGEAIKIRVGKSADGAAQAGETDHKVRVLTTRRVPREEDGAPDTPPEDPTTPRDTATPAL